MNLTSPGSSSLRENSWTGSVCSRDPGHPPHHHLGGGEGAGGVTAPTPAESVVRTWQRMEEEEGGDQALCPCYSGEYQEVNLFIYSSRHSFAG